MFGWINDCTECLVISKFGEDTWHEIKEKANCQVADGGFLRYKYYPDSDTVELVVAASQVLGISVDDVLYAFGDYFIDYVQDNGYSNVLECLGGNMRDWLSNLNSLHDHLQASYPKGFVAPVFWSEDDNACPSLVSSATTINPNSNAILVHYYSKRGSLLVPLVVGLIKKLARVYFSIEINMDQLQIQDEDNGVANTTWRITTVDPKESYKLRGKKKRNSNNQAIYGSNNNAAGDYQYHHHNNTNGHYLDDDTVTTTATSTQLNGSNSASMARHNNNKYERTFREGGTQAAHLRIEEFVMRSFYNEDCELFHALTLEQYLYLIDYWKSNKVDGKWCYEIWSIQDDDPKSWARLSDLPTKLNPETMDLTHFGGQIPATGKYPPNAQGTLQSFPPKVRVVKLNSVSTTSAAGTTDFALDRQLSSSSLVSSSAAQQELGGGPDDGMFVDLTLTKSSDLMLEDVIYNAPQVLEAGIRDFDIDTQQALEIGEKEIQVVIWDETTKSAYHTFSLGDLQSTSTLQLYELVPKTFDPIPIVFLCVDAIHVSDDEEDL